MKNLLINEEQALMLDRQMRRKIEVCKRKHERRKRSYSYDERYKKVIRSLVISFNPYLFTIPFKCSLSLYLYLYLKNRSDKTNPPELYGISRVYSLKYFSHPLEVRFMRIAKDLGFSRNTVKSAYNELIKIGLIMDTSIEYFPKHLSAKTCILYNDEYMIHFDKNTRKVYYSFKKS